MTSLYMRVRQALLETLRTFVPDVNVQNVVLESPRDSRNGDLATNAAMVLAKPLQRAPMEIAGELVERLRGTGMFKDIGAVAPGFINFGFDDAVLFAQVQDIVGDKTYGAGAVKADKALVEYVSINPTGPIHVGHGRNAVFGDAIANLLEKNGFTVWREYLVNDAGGQIRALVLSVHARYLEQFGQEFIVPEGGYPGEYLVKIAKELVQRDGDKWLQVIESDTLLRELRTFAVERCLAMIRADIETLGITFDRYFSEYEMHQGETMHEAVQALRELGYVYEGILPPPKGKTVENYQPVELTLFKATEFGFPEDQAIYKRNGEPTYFGQDIAYHYDKVRRGYALLVTVLGADQAGSFRPLQKVVELLTGKAEVYHPVAYEMVKVERDGQPVKLSKRGGNIVLLSDVLEEVGKDAFRFSMLTVKPTTPLVFDLAKAVEKSMENPVFYVQYAHARLASIWRQEAAEDLPDRLANGVTLPEKWRFSDEARAVMVTLMRYPLVIEQAGKALEPHRLVTYAQELAAAVHKWYAAEKWLEVTDIEGSLVRLRVAQAAQAVLRDVLGICGVSAPESM